LSQILEKLIIKNLNLRIVYIHFPMEGENSLIKKIVDKIENLIEERNTLKEKLAELTIENQKLKGIVSNKDENHETAKYENSIEKERLKQLKEAVKQLDQYTRELDECIQWIEKN